ncbi:IAA-leucine resistant 2-like [Chenopodium quinoa]|uniref:IAA-leucine resistant 2-like n=1 Tax=Chenopodium quinoa TaxID=63459 RepID=UPI000B78F3A6|nr:IAA-leucine resistant 2-like [Chenopodium quinoa]
MHFLDRHPLESLPVAAPRLPHFKTLCSSEIQIMKNSYGLVYPSIPSRAGPKRRNSFMRGITCTSSSNSAFFLPNIPGIIALLEDLNLLINGDPQMIPSLGKHIPVQEAGNQTKVFGYYSFPPLNEWSDFEKYALCSPGLQYPCEADKSLNKSFADSYHNFDFPTTHANDNLRPIANFLHMNNSMAWFHQVKAVAATVAKYFTGSGTLADCTPHGVNANQYVCVMQPPATKMITPCHSADKRALFPFALRLTTTVTNPNPHTEALVALAQTHIQMFNGHPYLSQFGHPVGSGPFWAFRPIAKSEVDDSSYLSLSRCVKRLMKYKE